MNFTIVTHPQRSPEWFAARAGRITGSCASAVTAKGKGGAESVVRRDYRLQLACERITGMPQEGGFVSEAMQRGIDLEPIAFAAYEAKTGNMVRTTGFLTAHQHMVGCSLDGDIEDFEGIIELKCPKTATHVGYLRDPMTLRNAYIAQVTHNLWVSGAKWCDLTSFDDRLPPPLRLVTVHIERDDALIQNYADAALDFLDEVSREVEALLALANAA
jgi:predicted phage-related endonuclease